MKKLSALIVLIGFMAACSQPPCDCSSIPELSQKIIALEREIQLNEDKLYQVYDTLNQNKPSTKKSHTPPKISAVESDIQILRTGFYHHDDINPNKIAQSSWMGLFSYITGKAYLKEVNIQLSKAHDAMVDNLGDSTGWVLKSPDDPLILVSGLDLKSGTLLSVKPPQGTLYPGQHFDFQLDNVRYTILATGTAGRGITNYSFQFSSNKSPLQVETLAHTPGFDDEMFDILWLGDLDGDQKPDFLMDISNHYNVQHLALFLSSKAPTEKLVAKVAELRTVGC